jgi:hypothetical protein
MIDDDLTSSAMHIELSAPGQRHVCSVFPGRAHVQ